MKNILVLSKDKRFQQMCEREFSASDRRVCLKSYRDLGSISGKFDRAYDTTIIHVDSGDDKWYGSFEKIRTRWPGMRIVFATDTYDYVYDFRYWMADACMVVLDNSDEYRTLGLLAAGLKIPPTISAPGCEHSKNKGSGLQPANGLPY